MDELRRLYAGYRDEYTIQQLRAEFMAALPERRLALLEELGRSSFGVPIEILKLAAEDSDSRIRAWCAQHYLTSVDPISRDRLIADADLLVRAKGIEGGFGAYTKLTESIDSLTGRPCMVFSWVEFPWQSATELERLAYLRGPASWHSTDFLLKLFDPENQELGMSQGDRSHYAFAFIAAQAASDPKPFGFRSRGLIELMPKWPEEAAIQVFVYRYCEPGDFVDVVYEHCDKPLWRAYLLENVLWRNAATWDSSERLLELARKDSDYGIRELAHMGMKWSVDRTIERAIDKAIANKDNAALMGLAKNKNLFTEELDKVFNNSPGPIKGWAHKTFAEKERSYVFEQLRAKEQLNAKSRGLDVQTQSAIKIDQAVNGVLFALSFIDDGFTFCWLGLTLGLLVAGSLYLISGNLGWTILALTFAIWAGLSFGMLCFRKLRRFRRWYGYPLGPLDYSDPEYEWHAEFEKKFGKDEYKELDRLRTLIWQMSQNNQDCVSTTAEPEEPQMNPKQETKRIERYKAALAAAKAGAAARAYEEEREEERQVYEKRRKEILQRREEMRKKRKNQTWSKTHHLRGSKIGIFPTK